MDNYHKEVKMSSTKIPEKTQNLLWARSAGRCEYKGCNEVLYQDLLTTKQVNKAYIAHIYAESSDGARYDPIESPKHVKDISNLMLLCDTHHRLIDREDVAGHPVDVLIEMKKRHEERIKHLTSFTPDQKITPIVYVAPIGDNMVRVSRNLMSQAIYKSGYYPCEEIIDLSRLDCDKVDSEKDFWCQHMESINRKIKVYIDDALTRKSEYQFALFGFAPIPLLVCLGNRLRDLTKVHVFQKHREPETWDWEEYPEGFEFLYKSGFNGHRTNQSISLVLAISADVVDERITSVMGENTDVWRISVPNPNNDIIKHPTQLRQFRILLRQVLNEIHKTYGESKELHIFPAVPISIAIEVGRVRNPKSDLPLVIYDKQKDEGFVKALTIK